MKILGIDPGSRFCGYAILEATKSKNSLIEAGLIKIKPSTLQYQITELCEGLDLIFKAHYFDEVAIEDIFFAYNPQSVLKLAQFRGALSLKILQLHGEFAEYTPLQIKKTITGKAKASKEQVAFMVKRLLGISKDIKPLDITDAIAIALTHAANLRIRV
ncbi:MULTISPECIES: crossover junction endodeoxyribonuclease RuvC [Campylobacter]|uniref:crossover junction endodeoxyribonuclease RuvC n=1 Tax=Campylobacter TaxID=194 RepID=UPI0009C20695|nr:MULTISPECIES: crossover junction endodeoxyribonuclease RuvC [Campylobacter]ARE81375.1 RuvABC resolvasome, subunit RuvC [Campylobacter helveticus]MCR2054920.1 crossover junction endodeoxyribonuclease RuvC [Campylobacter helveticus]MDL0109578.1 crossover junction endodeoxyribonuclease RuvC [Campylobacter felis]TNB56887.1 crossover junction endodeoxyribonuclease RuvC [Campylobacter helveticus]TNH32404.1 crossover junction endodeoxyribonuclease RuvC [Campylobacter helveticus]